MKVSRMTLAAALTRYLKTKEGTSGSTYANLKYRSEKLVGTCNRSRNTFHLSPDLRMVDLRSHHIAELKESRASEGLKPASINAEVSCLQRAYTLCRDEWDVPVHPGVSFKTLKTTPKTRYLSHGEIRMVRADLAGEALALFEVLLGSGCRLKEATALTWDRVGERSLEIYRTKTNRWSKVPLSGIATDALRPLLKQEQPFSSPNRAISQLRAAIDRQCNADKRRERATIHSLRDTFATILVTKGMSLYQVSRLLGHSGLSMTQKYAHLESDGLTERALELMQ